MKNTKIIRSLLCLVLILCTGLLPVIASAGSSAYILNVTADNARMRSGSGASSSVIGTLRKGTKVLYWGDRSGSLCKVCTSSGKIGYVYRNYLSVYGAIKKSQIYRTTTSTPVYKRSGSKLKKFTTLGSGKYVLVISQASGWCYVRTVTGKAGYIPAKALSRVF